MSKVHPEKAAPLRFYFDVRDREKLHEKSIIHPQFFVPLLFRSCTVQSRSEIARTNRLLVPVSRYAANDVAGRQSPGYKLLRKEETGGRKVSGITKIRISSSSTRIGHSPRQNRYRYRLEGLESNWNEVDGSRLDPGRSDNALSCRRSLPGVTSTAGGRSCAKSAHACAAGLFRAKRTQDIAESPVALSSYLVWHGVDLGVAGRRACLLQFRSYFSRLRWAHCTSSSAPSANHYHEQSITMNWRSWAKTRYTRTL